MTKKKRKEKENGSRLLVANLTSPPSILSHQTHLHHIVTKRLTHKIRRSVTIHSESANHKKGGTIGKEIKWTPSHLIRMNTSCGWLHLIVSHPGRKICGGDHRNCTTLANEIHCFNTKSDRPLLIWVWLGWAQHCAHAFVAAYVVDVAQA